MQNEFCTLFDVNYLPRGLVLYRSLARHCDDFRLRVFCMDERTKKILDELRLPRLTAISLDELEAHDPELFAAKSTRTQVEYCWTATPAICAFALENEPELEAITYLDADLMFFRDPDPIWRELGAGSVLIVPHRYTPLWQRLEEVSGIYNVEFLTFRRDERGLEALHWWRERCLEWCYCRAEDGKFGDQKYLDDWPTRFAGTHVLEHPGAGLAPWNVANYSLGSRNGSVLVDDRELVFYHFHSLRLYRGSALARALRPLGADLRQMTARPRWVWTTNAALTPREEELIWDPYLGELARVMREVPAANGRGVAGTRDLVQTVRPHLAHVRPVLRRARGKLAQPDHSQSWKEADVSRQMLELTREELREPETVPPYRAFLEAIDWILAELDVPDPARFLDFGCGVGHYCELLERRYPGRFEYTGCDYSPAMVEAAQAEWGARRFVVNDLFANTLDLRAFDIVSAGALVDVTQDYERALDALLGQGPRFVLLHRQQVTDGRSRVEVAAGYTGQTTYRSYLSRDDLERAGSRHGRQILASFHVQGDVHSFLFGEAAS